jgi:hypothetical protein
MNSLKQLEVDYILSDNLEEEYITYLVRIPLDRMLLQSLGWVYSEQYNRLIYQCNTMIDLDRHDIAQGWIHLHRLINLQHAHWESVGVMKQQEKIKNVLGL